MAASVGSPPSSALTEKPKGTLHNSSNFSPSSDKRFWSSLRSRVDTHLEYKTEMDRDEGVGKSKRMREDTALLLRGFDSVAHTLSELSSNIDNALQGAMDLAKPPTMTDMFQIASRNLETNERVDKVKDEAKDVEFHHKAGRKRNHEDDSHRDEDRSPADNNLKRAKNLAVSMATKAAFLARELKSLKSDMSFVQERCVILEEENEMLRHGYTKGIQPEEDDLVRLQLEALLAEKFRLANENANLTRENQCLRQIVEYHQVATSHDLSATYEEVINGICLDFSSPPSAKHDDGRNEAGERNVDSDDQQSG